MTYRVLWLREAEDELTRIWLGSRHRSQITQAAHALDADLSETPQEVGESREGTQRIVFFAPLAAIVELNEPTRTVSVLRVWLSR